MLADYQRHLFYALNEFDFNEWQKLFASNPTAAEKKRARMLEEMMHYVHANDQGLRDFQTEIDIERHKSATPLGSFMYLQDMFFKLVYGPAGFLRQISDRCDELTGLLIQTSRQTEKQKTPLKLVTKTPRT